MEDTTIEDVLKTVQNYYTQKDYQGALNTLMKNQDQVPSGIWHYNVGTVYGKLENWPMARFHFLRADSEGYTSKEAVLNRKLVEDKLHIEKFEKPTSASDYFYKYSMAATHGVFTTLGLLLIISGIMALWKKISVRITIAFFVSAVMVLGLNWSILSLDKKIVLSPLEIYEGPSTIFATAEELPEGVMIITSQKEAWLQIKYPSRFAGWIKDSGLKELK